MAGWQDYLNGMTTRGLIAWPRPIAPQITVGTQGAPEAPKPRGLFAGLMSDPDARARLAVALEGMTLNPNIAYMQMLNQGVQDRQAEKKTTAAVNKTVQWLKSQGRADLAAAVEAGALSASDAANIAMQPAPQQEPVRGVEIGGKLVNPITGEVIGDYSTPEPVPRPLTAEERQAWGIPQGDNRPYAMGADGMPEVIGGGGINITNQLPGTPGALTGANLTDAQKAAMAYESLNAGFDMYDKVFKETGGTVIPGKGKDALLTARRYLQLQMKELFNLGVLNGPDLQLMDQMLMDPTSFANNALDAMGAADLNARFAANLEQVRTLMRNMVEPKLNAMGGAAPAAPPASMPVVKNDADYDALPSGTQFIAPDGSTRRKP